MQGVPDARVLIDYIVEFLAHPPAPLPFPPFYAPRTADVVDDGIYSVQPSSGSGQAVLKSGVRNGRECWQFMSEGRNSLIAAGVPEDNWN